MADGPPRVAPPDGASDVPGPGRVDGPPESRAEAALDRPEEVGIDAPPEPPPAPGEVAIVEVLIDPAGNDLGREWIELANVAGRPLDLTGLYLADGTSDVAVEAGTLAADALLLLGQSLDPTKNGGAPVEVAYPTRLQLNNGGDRIAVCLGPCAGGVVLDERIWDASLGPGYVGHALVIDRDRGVVCPAEEPFGDGGSFGSPGRRNPPCPDEARATDGGTDAADGGADAADGGADVEDGDGP